MQKVSMKMKINGGCISLIKSYTATEQEKAPLCQCHQSYTDRARTQAVMQQPSLCNDVTFKVMSAGEKRGGGTKGSSYHTTCLMFKQWSVFLAIWPPLPTLRSTMVCPI